MNGNKNRRPARRSSIIARRRRIYVALYPSMNIDAVMVRGIAGYGLRRDWRLDFPLSSLSDVLRNGGEMLSFTDLRQCDGVILGSMNWLGGIPPESLDIPVVLMETEIGGKNLPHVQLDQAAIGRLAANELLPMRFASYAFVPHFEPGAWSGERGQAFLEAVQATGASAEAFPTPVVDWRPNSARLADWLAARPQPCGVFCANDCTARHTLSLLEERQLRVPLDYAVLGVDDETILCESAAPPLSSIAIDFEGAGRQAAGMLERLMDGLPAGPTPIYGPLSVVRRASTRHISPVTSPKLATGLAYIRREACAGAQPQDVADAMGMSLRAAQNLFRATGRSLSGEIREARLLRARNLLLSTGKPIGVILAECGFSSDVVFSRLFHRRFGLSPTRFRRRGTSASDSFLST
ncbi:MAG: substrate-binding domain-containing protein [Kiritimatiellia bacterium]|jgi:LacI family transcriptional regulator